MIRAGSETTRARVRELTTSFLLQAVPAGSDGQVSWVASRFALVAAAGELATAHEIVPWPTGTANAAVQRLFKEWLCMRGGTGAAEIATGIAQVRAFIEAHGETRFELLNTDPVRPVPLRAGFTRGSGEDRNWLILPEAWRGEVARGYDPSALFRALADRGMALLGEGDHRGSVKLQRKERSPLGNRRFYVITSRIFDDDEPA